DWPGNVRELENAIERAVVLGSTDLVLAEDLPEAVIEAQPRPQPAGLNYHAVVQETKKELILKAIAEANGSYGEAARRLGVHVNSVRGLTGNLTRRPAVRESREQERR